MANAHAKNITLKQEAGSPDASPARLASLAELSDEVAVLRAVARNTRTPPDSLEKLSHNSDWSIRKAVAGNPNTPAEILIKLGARYPLVLLENPALDLILLVTPGLLSEMPEEMLCAIANREDCTPDMLRHIAENGRGGKLLMTLLQHAATPPDAIKNLHEGKPWILAEHHKIPKESLRKIQPMARFHITQMPEPSIEVAMAMFWSEVVGMNRNNKPRDWLLFEAADLPGDIRLEILAWNLLLNNPEIVVHNISFPAPMLEAIAATANKRLLTAISKLPNVPEWLKGHSTSAQATASILKHEKESLANLLPMLKTKSNPIRLLMARHPLVEGKIRPSEVLEKMANDDRKWVKRYVAQHPDTPAPVLGMLAGGKHTNNAYRSADIRLVVAGNPNTPVGTLEELAKDYRLWHIVAGNPGTLATTLEQLANKKGLEIARSLAENPNTPALALEKLAKSEFAEVLQALIRNPNTPTSALALITRPKNKWIFEKLVKHPKLDADLLGKLFKLVKTAQKEGYRFSCEECLVVIAKNPLTPEPALKYLAKEDDELVRKAVASNPGSPIPLLEKLTKDKAASVSNAARKSLILIQSNCNS